ncbi:Homoisocitrate dehydrogenase [anaerobic digester metagenome]
MYGGIEWTNPNDQVYEALMSHPRFKPNFGWCPREELAVSTRIVTKKFASRIIRAAFEYAKKRGFDKITLCEKPNVIRETSGMMLKIAQEMSKNEYPDIWVEDVNIDAMMMWLTKNPENYHVIVSENMFGDIVSDAFAGLIGGLGFATSAQFNPDSGVAVFEPTHGSAPKYADFNPSIVNPIAMVLSSVLMLEHLNETEIANRIRKATEAVVSEGKVRAYDMLKMKGTQDVVNQGAASTKQMADAIIAKLK